MLKSSAIMVGKVFGVIRSSIAISKHRIDVMLEGEVTRYRRFDGENLARELDIVGDAYLELVPMYPVFLPKFITQYILCIFSKPIVLAPHREARVYMYLPIDFAVYVRNQTVFEIVDLFSVDPRPKYTLYGPNDQGVVARYCLTSYSFNEPEPRLGTAVSQLVIKNSTREFVTVNKVLLDSSPLRLYYKPFTWDAYTQLIVINITSSTTATLYYEEPFKAGLAPLNDPPKLRPPKVYNRTEMLWGY